MIQSFRYAKMAQEKTPYPPSEPTLTDKTDNMQSKAGKMDIFVFAAIVAAWIVLQVWILPKFGVQT